MMQAPLCATAATKMRSCQHLRSDERSASAFLQASLGRILPRPSIGTRRSTFIVRHTKYAVLWSASLHPLDRPLDADHSCAC